MARLIGLQAMNTVVSHLEGVREAVHVEAKEVGERAKAALDVHKKSGDHEITTSQGDVDSFVNLEGRSPLSVEYGHAPSGIFEGTNTRPPRGLYILGKAAGLAG